MDSGIWRYNYFEDETGSHVNKQSIKIGEMIRSDPSEWSLDDVAKAGELVKKLVGPLAGAAGAELWIARGLRKAEALLEKAAPYTRPLTAEGRVVFYGTAIALGVSGNYIGFSAAYDSEKYFDSDRAKALLGDPVFWRRTATLVEACTNSLDADGDARVLAEVASGIDDALSRRALSFVKKHREQENLTHRVAACEAFLNRNPSVRDHLQM
jgi:hypothetical protein